MCYFYTISSEIDLFSNLLRLHCQMEAIFSIVGFTTEQGIFVM